MKKVALIIGRFQPIHIGHLKLIERYYKAGFSIKIGIGSADKSFEKHNPLTGAEREEKIRKAMKEYSIKKFRIFHIPDISSDKRYLDHVLKIVGSFDTVITGNPSVLKLFLTNNKKHNWNIESFEESALRPGGKITSGIIRKKWLLKASKSGLAKSTYEHLKKINFSQRLKESK